MTRIAVLDDWQGIARDCADWSALQARAEVTFRTEPFADLDAAAAGLAPYDVLLAMRERQPFPAALIDRLPKLRMVALTGGRAPSMDMAAMTRRGVVVCGTGGAGGPATAELTIGLLLAAFRNIPAGDTAIRAGGFQAGVAPGEAVEGKTLGVIGLGRIGGRVARVASVLGMRVIAWSRNLTEEAARTAGVERVEKAQLFTEADAVTLHLVLSDRSRGIVGAGDIARMKPGALLINTSRGPLVDEAALVAALRAGRIRAALDVYDTEPLPPDHALRSVPGTVLTPHLGYGVRPVYAQFYRESIEDILAFLDGAPVRVLNPEAATGTG